MAEAASGRGLELRVIQRLRHDCVLSVAWSPDGKRLVSAAQCGNGYVLWDPFAGKRLHELKQPWAAYVVDTPVGFSADGRFVYVITDKDKMAPQPVGFGLWDVENGGLEREIPFPREYFPHLKGGTHARIIPIPGRPQVAVRFGKFPREPVLVYDTRTWQIVAAPVRIPEGGMATMDVSPDGRLLAIGNVRPGDYTGEPTGRIWLYEIDSGRLMRRIDGAHKDGVGHIKFSADGRFLASGPREGVFKLLNVTTGKGEDMADVDSVRVWEVVSGRKVAGLGDVWAGVSNLEFDPTGRWLAASVSSPRLETSPEARIWDWRTGNIVARRGDDNWTASVQHVAFSPDGYFVAMAGTNKRGADWIEIAEIMPK